MTSDSVNSGSETPASLLHNVVAKAPGAWDTLVEVFAPVVYGWLRSWKLQPQDAESVGNDVFVAVSQRIGEFQRGHRGAFHGWLWKIARNKFIDEVRQRQKMADAPGGTSWHELMQQLPQEEIDVPSQQQAIQQIYQLVISLIEAEFNPIHVQAFQMAAVNGDPAEEVANHLNTTKTVVYNAVARIRRRVREEFGDLLDDTRD